MPGFLSAEGNFPTDLFSQQPQIPSGTLFLVQPLDKEQDFRGHFKLLWGCLGKIAFPGQKSLCPQKHQLVSKPKGLVTPGLLTFIVVLTHLRKRTLVTRNALLFKGPHKTLGLLLHGHLILLWLLRWSTVYERIHKASFNKTGLHIPDDDIRMSSARAHTLGLHTCSQLQRNC